MSLNKHLKDKNSPVRKFIDEEFPGLKNLSTNMRSCIRGVQTYDPEYEKKSNYALVGHAIDYRLRLFFELPEIKKLVAFNGYLMYTELDDEISNIISSLLNLFFGYFKHWLDENYSEENKYSEQQSRELNIICVCLAQLETMFRSKGIVHKGIEDVMTAHSERFVIVDPEVLYREMLSDWLSGIDEEILRDMNILTGTVEIMYVELEPEKFYLNPKFGLASNAVGGADADLIVDNCLYDIKTTIHPSSDNISWMRQIVGYLLLDYKDDYNLDSIGIILPRQNLLWKISIEEVLEICDCPKNVDQLRNDFEKVLMQLIT